MKPSDIIHSENPSRLLRDILGRIHKDGPVSQEDMETLAYLKQFHNDVFSQEENRLMYLLGLFYKISEPRDLLSLSYSTFAESIEQETGQNYTPTQAAIRNQIIRNKYFSFSAPTSAGKSFLFRDLIRKQDGDMVIVVPSRALIAEYLFVVRDILENNLDVLVLQFIDNVNRYKTKRRVFIVTPERAAEVFKYASDFDIKLFLFDEAQIAEENIRGVAFDSIVRRADRVFPDAKKIFAHPFVENPAAQIQKHGFSSSANSAVYNQNAVGKIYLSVSDDNFSLFSPFIEGAHLQKNMHVLENDHIKEVLENDGSVLIYVSKSSIYDKEFEKKYEKYINLCPIITEQRALEIISRVEEMINATNKDSDLIGLMRRGVVVHHGSIPLPVRYLIERFTANGFARICFSTSTLTQGVNMPFDVVWVDNIRFQGDEDNKALGLKNLIGRAGRTTKIKNCFDYGFVVVSNVKRFVELLRGSVYISETSVLDEDSEKFPEDFSELIISIINNQIDDQYNIPKTRIERLESEDAQLCITDLLDGLFIENRIIHGNEYREMDDEKRKSIKHNLARIYEISLGRALVTGEKSVLSASVTILLWQIQGKTFKEILGLRYAFVTDQKQRRLLKRQLRMDMISREEYIRQVNNIDIGFSAVPHTLPNSKLKHREPSRFGRMKLGSFNYDLLVYDTYDYLDKVISFSLSDVFVAAFGKYYEIHGDERALAMVNYFRYGTNDEKEIWLLRYGFSFEDIEHLYDHVESIDQDGIEFKETVNTLADMPFFDSVRRYI